MITDDMVDAARQGFYDQWDGENFDYAMRAALEAADAAAWQPIKTAPPGGYAETDGEWYIAVPALVQNRSGHVHPGRLVDGDAIFWRPYPSPRPLPEPPK